MRILAVILSLTIFVQSLAVCGPHFDVTVREVVTSQETEKKSCHSESKKCCHSKDQDNDKKQKKDTCGQNCKCFCCIKVFFLSHNMNCQDVHLNSYSKKSIKPVFIHSFDFHQNVTNPPQI